MQKMKMEANDFQEDAKEILNNLKYSQVYPSVADPRKLKFQRMEVHFAGWNDFGEVLKPGSATN